MSIVLIGVRGTTGACLSTWNTWAFDHSGWHPTHDVVRVNQEFEGYPLEWFEITTDLADFCREHDHRMPERYYDDPRQRTLGYIRRFRPPWTG